MMGGAIQMPMQMSPRKRCPCNDSLQAHENRVLKRPVKQCGALNLRHMSGEPTCPRTLEHLRQAHTQAPIVTNVTAMGLERCDLAYGPKASESRNALDDKDGSGPSRQMA